ELGEVKYLLSPRDLAGLDAVGELAAPAGQGLKIGGRRKGPPSAHAPGARYRRAASGPARPEDRRARALAYSRGFPDGFLRGSDHQTLVDGRFPKHRGLLLGQVAEVQGERVLVDCADGAARVEVRAGMGVVFDAGHPEDPNEPGGPVFAVVRKGETLELAFGQPGPDLA